MRQVETLDSEFELRALRSPAMLSYFLTSTVGKAGSFNALLICTRVSLLRPGPGRDRLGFCHREQFSVSFAYGYGCWWWGDETKPAW